LNLFFDTSALVKYFHLESGTDQVVELIDNTENQIFQYIFIKKYHFLL